MRKRVPGNQAVCQECPLTNHLSGSQQLMRLSTNQRRRMSVGEERHADQLVVVGGACVISDSPVSWKSTTKHLNPGLWAYLGMIFLLLSLLSCQPVMGIDADIFPENAVIEVGSNLDISCILRNDSGAQMSTSSDIMWYKNHHIIPFQAYNIVNDTTSMISIINANLSNTATYHCALTQDTDASQFESSYVEVGYMPQPVQNLTCASHNILDYYCEWDPVPTYITNESHKFQFRYKQVWTDCPDLQTPNKCFISRMHHTGSTQEIHVMSSNSLGEAKEAIFFNPDSQTVPLPPENLMVVPKSSTVLVASWDIPLEWEPFLGHLLTYRIRWAEQAEPHDWSEELPCSLTSCEIRQLDPYRTYIVEVSSQHKTSITESWSDWSQGVKGRTLQAAPVGTVQNVQISNEPNMTDYERSVYLSWEPVPEYEQRGPILYYLITITPQSSCVDQESIFEDVANATEVIIHGLLKFCSYTVGITAYNKIGAGPVKEERIEDMTTNPLPPTVVRAETLSYQSVMVSWEKPTPIQGYISYYTVYWVNIRGQVDENSTRVPHSSLSYRVDGLEGYTRYTFKVSVTNRVGDSGWSMEAQATTHEWIPEAPPTNVTIEPITNNPNSLLVNWIDVPEEDAHGQIRSHNVYYCLVAEDSLSEALCSLDVSYCLEKREKVIFPETVQKPVMLTGVNPFSHYLIWVSASTSVGEGPTSACPAAGRTSEGTPSQPVNVHVTESTATSIRLVWSPPMEENGIIRNYTIILKSNTSKDQQEFYSGGNTSYLVEGLYGYINYAIQVRACTTVCGVASEEVYQKTEIGVPEQPSNVNVQPTSHNLVKVSWSPPVHPNGPIDHYRVSYRHQDPSTPSPALNVHVRSAAVMTTLANSIDEWRNTTDLTMKVEVVCSEAPFVFQVVAVNEDGGSLLVGNPAEYVLDECIVVETTLSPLIWLILPAGAILLFALVTSLYYVQSKLGKSWPDPVYTDMVKNKKDMHRIPKPKTAEKEEFDTIPIVIRPDLEEAIVAEEHPVQAYQCPVELSMDVQFSHSLDIKREMGGKDAFQRTMSTDSGVPPSPQDNLDFSGSEDVFDECGTSDWIHDTYSFGNPKVIVCQAGLVGKAGFNPKRSVSLSSSDGIGGLPAIEENKCMAPILEKIRKDADRDATSTHRQLADDYDDEDDDVDEVSYSRISKLSSPVKQPQVSLTDQLATANTPKISGPAESHTENKVGQTPSGTKSGMTSDSGYVRNDIAYMKFGFNDATQETSFKNDPADDDDYVPGPMNYSVLAIPQAAQQSSRSVDQPITSKYVSEESLAYTTLALVPVHSGKDIIPSSSSTVASVEQVPHQHATQSETIAYAKLGEPSVGEKQKDTDPTEQLETWIATNPPSPSAAMSDYVRGADLHMLFENKTNAIESPGCPGLPNSFTAEIKKVEPHDLSDQTSGGINANHSWKKAVRSRTDSSSSSSGYGSDNKGQVSGYVVVSNQQKENKSDNYANLAFTSSESETDSDIDDKPDQSPHQNDKYDKGKNVETLIDKSSPNLKNVDHDTSFVEYVSNDNFGLGFVNDYPSPLDSHVGVDSSRSVSPYVQTTRQINAPPNHEQEGCKMIPGYISHDALLRGTMNGIPPDVERSSFEGDPKPNLYQVPNRACRELDRTTAEIAEGDDGYVPYGGDSGYVLRVMDGSRTNDEYLPMSPISNTEIEEHFV